MLIAQFYNMDGNAMDNSQEVWALLRIEKRARSVRDHVCIYEILLNSIIKGDFLFVQ